MPPTTTSCTIPATPDLYGLGFRIGTYAQWLATLLSGVALPSEAGTMHANTLCFQVAMLASLVVLVSTSTSTTAAVRPPEVLVVVLLGFGGFLAAEKFEHHAHAGRGGTLRGFVVLQVFGGLVGYSLWFWWRGVVPPPGDDAQCVYYTFAFRRCRVESLRVFGIVASVLGGVLFVVAEMLAVMMPLLRWLRGGRKVAVQHIVGASPRFWVGGHLQMLRSRIWIQMGLSVVSITYLVVMVEMTIFWNPIVGANSMDGAGQILPLVFGVTGLVRVLYILLLRDRLPDLGH